MASVSARGRGTKREEWLAGWLDWLALVWFVFVSPGKDTNAVINCNLIAGSYLLSFCLIYKADICVRIIIIICA